MSAGESVERIANIIKAVADVSRWGSRPQG
jgi:hypothetical protein